MPRFMDELKENLEIKGINQKQFMFLLRKHTVGLAGRAVTKDDANKAGLNKEDVDQYLKVETRADFLEKVAPNITFLQYKKIRNHCVDQIEWHVHDYYSSGTTDACWRCDMKELYNLLKEMNYIADYE